jgi:HAD superfamily phosphoserine phosphatase-like hydrolase
MRLAVFDLDGTLIAGNSFHLWLLALLRWSLLTGRWLFTARLLVPVLARALRRISHLELKRRVIRLSLTVPSAVGATFAQSLYRRVRPELLACMARHKQQAMTVVIATAAPEVYLDGFARLCGADTLVGTNSLLSADWQENLRERKVQSLKERFGADMELAVVYSDHSDDLPLLRRAQQAVIVCPSPKQWQLIQTSGVSCVRM